eukprot:m.39586 g.39586  ORF g.39586 m.39586 type:complete len:415 (-) comp9570_c0_seq3:86-1330(-)
MGKKTKTSTPLVIEIVQAQNVPKPKDVHKSQDDPYAIVTLQSEKGKKKGVVVHTPVVMNAVNPVWNSYRSFQVEATDTDVLQVVIKDFNHVKRNEFIGKLKIPITELNEEVGTFDVELLHKNEGDTPPCTFQIRKVPYKPGPNTKTIYFIRHGYSEWNQAQEHHDIGGMLGARDHPLTEEGIIQAEDLQKKWTQSDDVGKEGTISRSLEDKFKTIQTIYTSPLTRALQTAVICFNGHEAVKNGGILCLPSAREIKGLGGIDCLGVATGEDIAKRGLEEMGRVKDEAYARKYEKTEIHPGVAKNEWWTVFKDNKKEAAYRINDFWSYIQFQDAECIAVVGHSKFFQKTVAKACKQARADEPSLQKELASGKHKLANCACLGMEVMFEAPASDGQAKEVALLYGSHLKGVKHEDGS